MRWRCDRWVLEASRLAQKREMNLNNARWLCCTAHEHRINNGRGFEEIEEKLGFFTLPIFNLDTTIVEVETCVLLALNIVLRTVTVSTKDGFRAQC